MAIDGEEEPKSVNNTSQPVEKPKSHLRIVEQPEPKDAWMAKFLRAGVKNTGPIRKNLHNAAVPLKHAPEFKGALRYNASALTVMLDQRPPWESTRPETWQSRVWNDNDDRMYTMWLERTCRLDLRMGSTYEAVQAVARERSFHPIREYLDSLTWDGKPRIARWLTTYLGVEEATFSNAVGLRWLVSAIARVMRPGVKADCMLILEGRQGTRKSTALMVLGGEWFTDEIHELGTRDCAMSLAGKWIVEFAELEPFKGAGLERLKAFLSRSVDRFRPPWGRGVVDSHRQCVFAGTTNHVETLSDATGNRRFWPMTCGAVDIDALQRDRDQLWAEAKVRYESGQVWWLETLELQHEQAEEAEERFDTDPMEDEVRSYITKKTEISVHEILTKVFELDVAKTRNIWSEQRRVTNILTRLGWEKERGWKGVNRGKRLFKPKNAPSGG